MVAPEMLGAVLGIPLLYFSHLFLGLPPVTATPQHRDVMLKRHDMTNMAPTNSGTTSLESQARTQTVQKCQGRVWLAYSRSLQRPGAWLLVKSKAWDLA